ncbi:uncharacterized protein LOC115795376 isoform X2 [Archocentrus centrarchus]|uniref:uncharacterized protein LOC115795376 isoform X2 n=1 Tax=Archocentrus centrarchus TaxID=63155 RepID=UPI0011E9EF8F|nr:uncharacterized protein LOC115795376 isoform X2 [Archocentrus centrarchus]
MRARSVIQQVSLVSLERVPVWRVFSLMTQALAKMAHPLLLHCLWSFSPATISASTSSFLLLIFSVSKTLGPSKGFWRVARPETLLLNGCLALTIYPPLTTEGLHSDRGTGGASEEPKPPERGNKNDVGGQVNDCDASSEIKNSDSVEWFVDRCEQEETDITDPSKGLCSSDSSESMSSQSGVLCADDKLKVKERAYAKLRERQQHYKEAREQHKEELLAIMKKQHTEWIIML